MTYEENPAINHSKLKDIAISPKYFYEKHIKKSFIEEKTSALNFGSAFHLALLEPEKFVNQVAILPNIDKRTKKGVQEYEEFIINNNDKILLTQEEYNILIQMQNNLWDKKFWNEELILDSIEYEIYFSYRGLDCKCKIDNLDLKNKIIWELKSTASANINDFTRSINKFYYDTQAAFQLIACENKFGGKWQHRFIVCEKKAPYDSICLQLPDYYLNDARITVNKLIDLYKQCLEWEYWPGHNEAIQIPEIKPWFLRNK